MNETEEDRLSEQLIKLGDMMSDGLHYEEPWIAQEYRRIAKRLHPEAFPRKKPCYTNKPSKSIVNSLLLCTCGHTKFGWERKEGLVRFYCPKCNRTTGFYNKNSLARDEWNRLAISKEENK